MGGSEGANNEKEKHEWDLVLEEYKTLRQEISNKMDKQYQIMGLGVGGISVLLGFAFAFQDGGKFPIF